MQNLTRKLGSVALAATAALATVGIGAQSADAATSHTGRYKGCPAGDACLYAGNSWKGTPTKYYHYGSHNLHNVYGKHYFLNNQTGGAIAYICKGYNGTGSCFRVNAFNYTPNFNFTPYNSIYLSAKPTHR